MEHVTFLGSKRREDLLGTGARANAYTDFHHTVFHVHAPAVNGITGQPMLPQVGRVGHPGSCAEGPYTGWCWGMEGWASGVSAHPHKFCGREELLWLVWRRRAGLVFGQLEAWACGVLVEQWATAEAVQSAYRAERGVMKSAGHYHITL